MSSNLGNGYIGADINFINDATQEALDDKANLAGGNTLTGNQNLNAGNLVIQASGGHNIQTPQIVGNSELYMRTLGDANIRLEPAGSGEITGTKDINLSAGKAYKVNGVDILTDYATTAYVDAEDAKKANKDGGNTLTGNQNLNAGNIVIQATGGHNLQTPQIVGNSELYMRTLGDANIRLEPAGTGEITGTKDINLSAGKAYKVNGVNILNNIPTNSNVVLLTGDQDINGIKSFKSNIKADSNLLVNTDAGLIKLGSLGDRQIARTTTGISTNGTMNATQYNVNNVQISSSNLSNNTELVKTTGSQTLTGKTIDANANTIQNIKNAQIGSNAGIVYSKLNILDNDLTIAKTNGLQGALDGKASDTAVVKLSGAQTISDIKTFDDNVIIKDNLLLRSDNKAINFGSGDDINITHLHNVGLSTNGTFSATQYNITGTGAQIASSNLSNDAKLVKTDTTQTISGVKTFNADTTFMGDMLIKTDAGLIKLGVAGDREIARTATGISTNGTMNATQYNVNNVQISSSNLSNDGDLVKTSGIQTINGAKTFGDKMIVNNEVNVNGVFKHTFNASTNVGIQLDNNNVNQYALNATTLGYGWRWRGEQTSGGDTDLFDVRTKKGGTSHKVFNVSNADIIRMIGSVRIDATGTNLNLVGIPEGTGATKDTEPAGLSVGDVWRAGVGSSQNLKIKSS